MAGRATVAASGHWRDEDGVRLPSGSVHAWVPPANQTVCGLPLHRAGLERFSHIPWEDILPSTGGAADQVGWVCERCDAAVRGRRRNEPEWRRSQRRGGR
jgi:hypothetical protein